MFAPLVLALSLLPGQAVTAPSAATAAIAKLLAEK